jgi:hypothetical protein
VARLHLRMAAISSGLLGFLPARSCASFCRKSKATGTKPRLGAKGSPSRRASNCCYTMRGGQRGLRRGAASAKGRGWHESTQSQARHHLRERKRASTESGAKGRGARSYKQPETAGGCCSCVRQELQSLGGTVALIRWLRVHTNPAPRSIQRGRRA